MYMKNFAKNKNKGFIELIIVIVVAIFLMSYFHVTLSTAWNWFANALHNIFQ